MLTTSDLQNIRQIMQEEIQLQVPVIIQREVPPLVRKIVQEEVPPIVRQIFHQEIEPMLDKRFKSIEKAIRKINKDLKDSINFLDSGFQDLKKRFAEHVSHPPGPRPFLRTQLA